MMRGRGDSTSGSAAMVLVTLLSACSTDEGGGETASTADATETSAGDSGDTSTTGTDDGASATGDEDGVDDTESSDATSGGTTSTEDTGTTEDDTDSSTEGESTTETEETGDPPACFSYESQEEEFAPIQTAGAGLPPGADVLTWTEPTSYEYIAPFAGTPGNPASHEGADYVHPDGGVPEVPVYAAAGGTVVYVRLGCPQSDLFGFNTSLRECGSGWGNHVIVDHGAGVFTRYGHMHPVGTVVEVADVVTEGEFLGVMGNSGRSDERHLHFELASFAGTFDPCAPAQSFDTVYDPEGLTF